MLAEARVAEGGGGRAAPSDPTGAAAHPTKPKEEAFAKTPRCTCRAEFDQATPQRG